MTGSAGFDLIILFSFLFNVYLLYCMRKWKRLRRESLDKKPALKLEVELSFAFSNHDFELCRDLIEKIEKEDSYNKAIIERIKTALLKKGL